jgi:thioredoxin-like negative regulator of GroEL
MEDCGHCKDLIEFAKTNNLMEKIVLVDCNEHRDIATSNQITGTPSFVRVDKSNNSVSEFQVGTNKDILQQWLSS